MKKEESYGWHLPDKEFRTQQLISEGIHSLLGTQGNVERDLAIDLCENPEEEICIDIGGHIGIFAKDFSERFKHTIVFEPILEHYECILKNLEGVSPDKYEVHNVAIGGKNRDAEIYYADANTGQSRVLREDGLIFNYEKKKKDSINEDDMTKGNLIDIRITRLDDYIKENEPLNERLLVNNEKIGLIKIDVEGYEPDVLLGAREIIEHAKPLIMMELLDYGKIPGGYGQKTFWIMRQLGYNYITRSKKNFIFAHKSSKVQPSDRAMHEATKKADNYNETILLLLLNN